MSILLWIVFGALVGFIADYIDSSVHLSWLERTVVGIVGAVVGGTLATLFTTGNLNFTAAAGFDVMSIIIAVVGALIAIFVWKRFRPSSLAR
jgi:uncharacterized membrane protein YeaQ/YmgE (transglycosylase-associated protein family)